MSLKTVKNLKRNGIIKTGTFVKNGDILIGKIKKIKQENTLRFRLLSAMFGKVLKKDKIGRAHV